MSGKQFVLPLSSDNIETVANNHKLVLNHLLDLNIEDTLKTFFKDSLLNSPLYPEAKLSETAYIESKIFEGVDFDNMYPSDELFTKLKNHLTPSTYLNISSLLNGNPQRFIKMICFGIVTKYSQTVSPFMWGGPFIFSQTQEGLIISITPKGVYISSLVFEPYLLENSSPRYLIESLNNALNSISNK